MTKPKVLGIIAEYNPFHSGHLYHINEAKKKAEADYVVVVMSGDFTQRGEPAFLDKWSRSEMAVKAGVDLVIELPFVFACNSAEYFATGGVTILNGLGVVTDLAFGSECGDIKILKNIANKLSEEDPLYQKTLKTYLSQGLSFPKARQLALGEEGEVLAEPNNILAVEYLKALNKSKSSIRPITIKRRGSSYNSQEVEEEFASASSLRKTILEGRFDIAERFLPEEIREQVFGGHVFDGEDMDRLFFAIKAGMLRESFDVSRIGRTFGASEGLENIVPKVIRRVNSFDQLAEALKSKRYTKTRINRFLIQYAVGFFEDSFDFEAAALNPGEAGVFARVLAFNEKGARLLKFIKKQELNSIDVITKVDRYNQSTLAMDIKASDIYNLVTLRDSYLNSDFVKKPFIYKSY